MDKIQVTVMFIAVNPMQTETLHHTVAYGPNETINTNAVKLDGIQSELSLLGSAKAELERLIKKGWEITHTGELGPKGAREFVDWYADYNEDFSDYAEWKDGNKVRGTLKRIRVNLDSSKTIISEKKTFRNWDSG
tara:strand:+ start:354 stop:758 length:405 start_codon:yes stop_codon:yes gene_type:complete